jgi:peroxiredoxin
MSAIGLIENKKNWNLILVAVVLFGTGWIYLTRTPEIKTTGGGPPPSPKEGFSAPAFSLDLLDGENSSTKVSLSDYRGQVVMINFWATWCTPCREEMPAIQAVFDDYQEQGFVVLAVNTTFQDSEIDVKDFVSEFNLEFPILLDRSGEVSQQYQLRGLPSTYFVDKKGVIQAVIVGGPMNETMIRSRVEALLKEVP